MSNDVKPQRPLIVMLHGFSRTAEDMKGAERAAKEAFPEADIMSPPLPFSNMFCTQPAASIALDLVKAIDRRWDPAKHDAISIVGHSFGALLARKVVIIACGQNANAPFEAELSSHAAPRPWASKIKRLVLMAGITRGWTVSSAIDTLTAFKFSLGSIINELVLRGRGTIFGAQRGAPFIVQTRLQWLALNESAAKPDLVLVQLLGTIDDLVSPDDGIDYSVDGSDDKNFFFIEVPNTKHLDAIDLYPRDGEGPGSDVDQQTRAARREHFKLALAADRETLASRRIPRAFMSDSMPPEPEPDVRNVAFIIHGIRDKGFWTQKIARVIKREATAKGEEFRCVTASYGYFAMAPFVLPWTRRQKVAWLMDVYTEMRARFPNARFHYVGHSNGTYLAARALKDYPAVKFKRMVLAGSVIRRDFQWSKYMAPQGQQVSKILNYVATNDWVVALFPKALQPIRAFDLGSAGHDGFDEARNNRNDRIKQIEFIRGAHSAGLKESQWDEIANFIVSGIRPTQAQEADDFEKIQNPRLCAAARVSTGLLLLLVAIVLAPAAALVLNLLLGGLSGAWVAVNLIGLGLYLWLVRVVLTRV